jgi:lysozyme family protein
MSLTQALAFTLPEEGGFVDNPNDDGGATDHGITQHVYDGWRAVKGLPIQSVALITDAEVTDIYEKLYWIPGHCGELSPALGVVHFDWCVNHGVGGAIKTLQRVLGISADGVFGGQTRTALEGRADKDLVNEYTQIRADWYNAFVLARPAEAQFRDGWIARDFKLQSYALGLVA